MSNNIRVDTVSFTVSDYRADALRSRVLSSLSTWPLPLLLLLWAWRPQGEPASSVFQGLPFPAKQTDPGASRSQVRGAAWGLAEGGALLAVGEAPRARTARVSVCVHLAGEQSHPRPCNRPSREPAPSFPSRWVLALSQQLAHVVMGLCQQQGVGHGHKARPRPHVGRDSADSISQEDRVHMGRQGAGDLRKWRGPKM